MYRPSELSQVISLWYEAFVEVPAVNPLRSAAYVLWASVGGSSVQVVISVCFLECLKRTSASLSIVYSLEVAAMQKAELFESIGSELDGHQK